MEFRSHTLENGLEVVAEVNPDAYSTALGFFVRTGARDENGEVLRTIHEISTWKKMIAPALRLIRYSGLIWPFSSSARFQVDGRCR